MPHYGTARQDPTEVAVLELMGPDAEGRLGVSVGPHKGPRHTIWLNRGAADDAMQELHERLMRVPPARAQRGAAVQAPRGE